MAEIGPITGLTLPPTDEFSLQGRLTGSGKALSLKEARGKARRGSLSLETTGAIKDLAALTGMDLRLKADGKELAEIGPLVVTTIPELGPFDFSGHLNGSSQPFSLGDLTAVVDQCDFKGRAKVEVHKRPKITLVLESSLLDTTALLKNLARQEKELGQDFDLGGLLRELRLSEEVRSHLDIAVDVNGRGGSMHDLMAGLDGSVGAVMGQGYLTHYLDLLSVGLTTKVIKFWGQHKKGGEIRCAVVQFDVNSGTATSRAFVFDTEAGVLTGEGDLNLATEQVSFLLVPEPRHPSFTNLWTKLRVSGPIMAPKVRPDTLSLLAPFVNLGAYKAHPCEVHSIGKP